MERLQVSRDAVVHRETCERVDLLVERDGAVVVAVVGWKMERLAVVVGCPKHRVSVR